MDKRKEQTLNSYLKILSSESQNNGYFKYDMSFYFNIDKKVKALLEKNDNQIVKYILSKYPNIAKEEIQYIKGRYKALDIYKESNKYIVIIENSQSSYCDDCDY